MSTNPKPAPLPSDPPITHLSMLPIEVHENQFKHAMRAPFQKGLQLSALLPYVQKVLMQTRDSALQLPAQILEEEGEIHYLSAVKSLETMSCWIKYLLQVYQETLQISELSASDHEQLLPLRQLEQEIKTVLEPLFPTLLEKRMQKMLKISSTLKQSILTMQKKTELVAHKIAVTYQLVSPQSYECAKLLLTHFFKEFIEISEQMMSFINEHAKEWNTLTLQQGRDLFITAPKGLPCSFLFSLEGNCYPLIESVEHLLGRGSDKIVFRAISLPLGGVKAIIKPSPTKELISSQKQKRRHKNQLFNMWTESELLLKLRKCPGIIQINERMVFKIEDKKQLFLVEDYYWDGSLHDYFNYTIKESSCLGQLSLQKQQAIIRQTLNGLIAIHQAGMLHHDIKPDNILIDDSEEEIKAAIADFQLAAYAKDKNRLDYLRCRAAWSSPEYARLKLDNSPKKHYYTVSTQGLDIWSLGIVFYILTSHSYPSWVKEGPKPKAPSQIAEKTSKEKSKESEEEIISKTDEKEQEIFEKVALLQPDWLPEEIRKNPFFPLLERMLDVNPETRCSAEEALKILESIEKTAKPTQKT